MIMNYITNALSYAFLYSIIHIIVRKTYLKRKKRFFIIKKEISYLLFGAYIIALLSQTIMPIWNVFFIEGKMSIQISTYESRNINLIPFKTIIDYLSGKNDIYDNANLVVKLVNLCGNISLFIPYGILFPLTFFNKDKFRFVVTYGILLSIFIEIVQYFVERSTDIDDVILNMLGVIVGFVIYTFIIRSYKKFKH